ncbi:hypothetical protein [Streptomyces hydrogenans]|uniref:hypothetical protein n=1 Tax=Streptomyces hydrogenans TaxID=1873719 RepID=UPI0035DDE4A2
MKARARATPAPATVHRLSTGAAVIGGIGHGDAEVNAVRAAVALEPLDTLFRIAWVGDCCAYG